MPTLADALLSDAERRVVERIVERLRTDLGDRLEAVWLFGSRARGERSGSESDVDLMTITAPGAALGIDRPSDWLADRREIRSFFMQEVDRDKIVLWESG